MLQDGICLKVECYFDVFQIHMKMQSERLTSERSEGAGAAAPAVRYTSFPSQTADDLGFHTDIYTSCKPPIGMSCMV